MIEGKVLKMCIRRFCQRGNMMLSSIFFFKSNFFFGPDRPFDFKQNIIFFLSNLTDLVTVQKITIVGNWTTLYRHLMVTVGLKKSVSQLICLQHGWIDYRINRQDVDIFGYIQYSPEIVITVSIKAQQQYSYYQVHCFKHSILLQTKQYSNY